MWSIPQLKTSKFIIFIILPHKEYDADLYENCNTNFIWRGLINFRKIHQVLPKLKYRGTWILKEVCQHNLTYICLIDKSDYNVSDLVIQPSSGH